MVIPEICDEADMGGFDEEAAETGVEGEIADRDERVFGAGG